VRSRRDTPRRFESERLVLRAWEVDDAPALAGAIAESLDHLARWFAWARAGAPTIDQAVSLCRRYGELYDAGEDLHLAVFDRRGLVALGPPRPGDPDRGPPDRAGRLVGAAAIHPRAGGEHELGYWLHATHVGRGYGTEIVTALARFAIDRLRATRLIALVHPANDRSAAVLRRVGFAPTEERAQRDGDELVVWRAAARSISAT
jgi:RimJ/RimL family protein N-acetyltransferase